MLKGQVGRLLLLRGIWYFIVLQSVAVPFFTSRGLSSTQIFIVQAVFLLTLCLLDIPTSLFAVRWGIRRSLLIGCVLKGLGGTLLLVDAGPTFIYLSYFLIAAGNAFFSGLDYTLLFNQVLKRPGGAARLKGVQGSAHAVMLLCITTSGVIGAFIAQQFGFETLIWVNAVLAWLSFFNALSLEESRAPVVEASSLEVLKTAWKIVVDPSRSRFVVLVVLGELVPSVFPYLLQFRMAGTGDGLIAMGLVVGFQNAFGAACGLILGRLDHARRRALLSGATLILLLWLGGIGLLTVNWSMAVVAAVVLAEVARAITAVFVSADFHLSFDGPLRPAVSSVIFFLSRLFAVVCFLAFAYAADFVSIEYICTIFIAAIALLTAGWLTATRRSTGR